MSTLVLWTVSGVCVAAAVAAAPSFATAAGVGPADLAGEPASGLVRPLVGAGIGVGVVALTWALVRKLTASRARSAQERYDAEDNTAGPAVDPTGVAGSTDVAGRDATVPRAEAAPQYDGENPSGLAAKQQVADGAAEQQENPRADTTREVQEQFNKDFDQAMAGLRSTNIAEQTAGIAALGELARAQRPTEPATAEKRANTGRCLAALCEFVRTMQVPDETPPSGGAFDSEANYIAAKAHPGGALRSADVLAVRRQQQHVLSCVAAALPTPADVGEHTAPQVGSTDGDALVGETGRFGAESTKPAYVLDLAEANLVRHNFVDPNWLTRSGMVQVLLPDAHLKRAVFAGMDLGGADFQGADLDYASLRGCVLRGANMTEACVGQADLRAVDAPGVVFARADLGESVLSEATLTGADMSGVYLANARMGGVCLVGATMQEARGQNANMARADLTGVAAQDSDFCGGDFYDATLGGADFSGANLAGANMRRANCGGTDFSGANLERADLRQTVLAAGVLCGAQLAGADARGAVCGDADLWGATVAVVLPGHETVTMGEILGEQPWQMVQAVQSAPGPRGMAAVHDLVRSLIGDWVVANDVTDEDAMRLIDILPRRCFPAGGVPVAPGTLLAKATAVTFGYGGFGCGTTTAVRGIFDGIQHWQWLVENNCVDYAAISWEN